MASYDDARERFQRLTFWPRELPRFCQSCCREMFKDQEIIVLQRRQSIRVVHKQCRQPLKEHGYGEAEGG